MNLRPLRTWLVLCCLCLWVLTGCTSSLAPDPKAGDISTAVPLNLGFSPNPSYLPWLVARKEDLFEARQQNIDAKWFEEYGEAVAALESGLLDLNPQSAIDTIRSVAAGADLSIVLVSDRSMGNEKIIASDAIQTIADLKGKKIALARGAAHHLLLFIGLQRAKLSLEDVEIEVLDAEQAVEAFVSGEVEAIGLSAPHTTFALARNGSRELWSSVNFPGLFFNTLSVRRQILDRYPEKVRGAVEVWFETLDFIRENPEKTEEMMADRADVTIEQYRNYDSRFKSLSLAENSVLFESDKTLDSFPVALKTLAQLLVESGSIELRPELTTLLNRQFLSLDN
ncbi:MAG: aliphatic sulfonate ABC transporter substrate-binding protein [Cyanobacteriota bacterium]|nr:aliphatic sulfonate ABC transporter substrate-binding protein [Cyanobacteriota bacterium]